MGVGSHENEQGTALGFLQGLEQAVLGLDRHPVGRVEDHDPVARLDRLEGDLPDQVPDLFDADHALPLFRLDQVQVGMAHRHDLAARAAAAGAVRPPFTMEAAREDGGPDPFAGGTAAAGLVPLRGEAIDEAGEHERQGAFADPGGAGEDHAVRQPVAGDRAAQDVDRPGVADEAAEVRRRFRQGGGAAHGNHRSSRSRTRAETSSGLPAASTTSIRPGKRRARSR